MKFEQYHILKYNIKDEQIVLNGRTTIIPKIENTLNISTLSTFPKTKIIILYINYFSYEGIVPEIPGYSPQAACLSVNYRNPSDGGHAICGYIRGGKQYIYDSEIDNSCGCDFIRKKETSRYQFLTNYLKERPNVRLDHYYIYNFIIYTLNDRPSP